MLLVWGTLVGVFILRDNGTSPPPPEPPVEETPFRIDRGGGDVIFANGYELREGAVVVQGYYRGGTYYEGTLVVLDGMVAIERRDTSK